MGRLDLFFLSVFLFCRQSFEAEENARGRSTQSWRQQENPKLRDCFAADEDRRSKAARRVHAVSSDVNANQVSRYQRKADHHSGEARGCSILRRTQHHDHK